MNTPAHGVRDDRYTDAEYALSFEASNDQGKETKLYCDIGLYTSWGDEYDVLIEGMRGGVLWDKNFDVVGQLSRRRWTVKDWCFRRASSHS